MSSVKDVIRGQGAYRHGPYRSVSQDPDQINMKNLGFSRQEYWNGLPCPSPGDLPNPGFEPESPAFYADSLPSEPPMCLKKVKWPSRVRLFVISWTVAYQAPPSMEFSRQEYWSGLLFPSPGDLPDVGNKLFPI